MESIISMASCESKTDERQDGEISFGPKGLKRSDCSVEETKKSSPSMSLADSEMTFPTSLLKGLKVPSTFSTVLTISLCFSGAYGKGCQI